MILYSSLPIRFSSRFLHLDDPVLLLLLIDPLHVLSYCLEMTSYRIVWAQSTCGIGQTTEWCIPLHSGHTYFVIMFCVSITILLLRIHLHDF